MNKRRSAIQTRHGGAACSDDITSTGHLEIIDLCEDPICSDREHTGFVRGIVNRRDLFAADGRSDLVTVKGERELIPDTAARNGAGSQVPDRHIVRGGEETPR